MNDNKQIAINTLAIYIRLFVTVIISLITSRYVLLSLGQSDFGLYSVVGSIITFINIIGVAMFTTTRRYINIEMGKGNDGNANKIFNVSLIIHIGFAVFFLIIAESIGIWYINNFLNVDTCKLSDAHYIFQVSSIVACLSLINVPYQGLMNAYQKFWQIASIDIFICILKLGFVLALFLFDGNKLRFYALAMSSLTFVSFVIYHIVCRIQWKNIISFKLYWDKKLYKEILIFNNYIALGAASCLGRTQGSTMLVNYFFGTMVNGAFAIAYQVQQFTGLFATNLSQASAPQITQAFSAKNYERSYNLTSSVTRITILIMLCIVAPLLTIMDNLLLLWLKNVPQGAPLYCRWILIVALFSTFGSSLNTYVHAIGKVKWFQILCSIVEISLLPISYYLFNKGFPPETILVVLVIITLLNICTTLVLLKVICGFKVLQFINATYLRPIIIITIQVCLLFLFSLLKEVTINLNLFICTVFMFAASMMLCLYIGLKNSERVKLYSFINNKFLKKRTTT